VLNLFTPVVETVWSCTLLLLGMAHALTYCIPLYYSEPVVLLLLHLAKQCKASLIFL